MHENCELRFAVTAKSTELMRRTNSLRSAISIVPIILEMAQLRLDSSVQPPLAIRAKPMFAGRKILKWMANAIHHDYTHNF